MLGLMVYMSVLTLLSSKLYWRPFHLLQICTSDKATAEKRSLTVEKRAGQEA
jgi:hypothetical protein